MRITATFLFCLFLSGPIVALASFDKGVLDFENEDFASALKAFQPLAKAGNAEAMAYIGRIYDEGLEQPEEAAAWFLKAAQKGHTESRTRLAEMYQTGEGVPQNDVLALEWYAKAATQGDDDAQLALGEHAEQALGDMVAAQAWYEKAAAQNNGEAQYRLGLILISDEGVARDVPRAWLLFSLAGENDIDDAVQARDVLELEMEPVELRQAQALLQQWKKSH